VTSRIDHSDPKALLQATRHALVACCDGLDPHAVEADTPLAALLFDSLTAANFIANLEATLGLTDLPFERWLEEHSERTDALTIGSLVEWLRSVPQLGHGAGAAVRVEAAGFAVGRG
jgi:hypothetical protein